MEIINLTNHKLKFTNWEMIESLWQIRLWRSSTIIDCINWINILKNVYSGVKIPEKIKTRIYIVSKMVCEWYPDRDDFYIVANTKRWDNGQIICWEWLAKNPYFKYNKKKYARNY